MKKRLILFFLIYFLAGQYNLFAWEAEEFNRQFHQAKYLYENGRYKEAIIEFRKALEIFPDNIIVKDYIKNAEKNLRRESIVAKKKEKPEKARQKVEAKQERLRRIRQARVDRIEQKAKAQEERKQKKGLAIKTKEELKAMQKLQRLAKEEERAKPLTEEVSPEQTKSQEKQKALDKIRNSIRDLLKKKP